MTVSTFLEDDLFTIRVTKSLSTNPSNQWANSYEFIALAPGGESELLDLGGQIVEFEAAIHLGVVVFQRLLMSTWEPDSVPYNPATFISTSLSATGANGATGDALALNQTFTVTRQAAFGRFGHLFYRGVLTEAGISAPAGFSVLEDRDGQQDLIDDALASSSLGDSIGLASTGPFRMVMVNADGSQVRPIVQLRAQGVSAVPLDHAWFNRTTGP